jgi:hypothetical protein
MTFGRFMRWAIIERIRKIRPFWYLDYNKEDARALLEKKFGWEYYGGHHLENRMCTYFHGVYAPQKFDTDFRSNSLAALVRMGSITREKAWKEYNTEPRIERELLDYVRKRLDLSEEEYRRIMSEAPRSWQEFPTYKRRFEVLRPLFYSLAKANLVPMSFYLKYCFPVKKSNQS